MESYRKLVAKKLKTIIKEKFKTQKEFASQFNITERTISNWMIGKNYPNLEFLEQIANHCHLHISYFFTDDSNTNVINQELFNQVFKLAYKFAEEQDIKINGSYFLGCYDLVITAINKEKIDVITAFNNNKPIILKFMK